MESYQQTKKTSYVIKKVYGTELVNGSNNRFKNFILRYLTGIGQNFKDMFSNGFYRHLKLALLAGVIFLMVLIIFGIHYFNDFNKKYQNILASEGQIDSYLQRRRNVTVNIAKIVFDYSKHEKLVFNNVVNSRKVFAPKAPKTILPIKNMTTENLISKLMALSEQYPDLKLSQNFMKFTEAIVEIEKSIAISRIDYNNFVNIYTTRLLTFPGNFYNMLFRFQHKPYYRASEDAKYFREVSY